jgi:hypothetical protein
MATRLHFKPSPRRVPGIRENRAFHQSNWVEERRYQGPRTGNWCFPSNICGYKVQAESSRVAIMPKEIELIEKWIGSHYWQAYNML